MASPKDIVDLNESWQKMLTEVGYPNGGPELTTLLQLVGTTEAMTLYVDGANGSDRAAGTQDKPLKTIQAVFDLLPRTVNHAVTINIAAGTYAEALTIGPIIVSSLVIITINGAAQELVVPTTGTATGTVTSVSNTSIPLPTVTDSVQTWTVNELRGRILRIGTNQDRVIVSNTSTTLTFDRPLSTVSVGNAYQILTPSTIISSPVTVRDILGGGTINIVDIDFSSAPAANIYALTLRNCPGRINLRQCRVRKTNNTAGGALLCSSSSLSLSSTFIESMSSGASIGLAVTTASGNDSYISSSPGFYVLNSHASNASSVVSFIDSYMHNGPFVAETTSTTAASVVSITGNSRTTAAGLSSTGALATLAPVGHTGIGVKVADSTSFTALPSCLNTSRLYVVNSATGLSVNSEGAKFVASSETSFNNCTNGIVVTRGASVQLPATNTFTTVTNELTIDGTISTYATLVAAVPSVLNNSSYFSKIMK
jgi:hypothetical protein